MLPKLMLRRLYLWLLQLHPAPFRTRFGDEMVDIFDRTPGIAAGWTLVGDVVLSLVRQWVFRPEFHTLTVAGSAPAVESGLFQSLELYKPRPAALVHGGLMTLIILFAGVTMIGKSKAPRAHLFGALYPRPHLFAIDRSSVEETGLDTNVHVSAPAEDPLLKLGRVYFRAIRVLGALDANHDLAISQWEIAAAGPALRKLDINHDGMLSAEECGFLGASQIPPQLVSRARHEFMSGNAVLAALDADHDETISAYEIANGPAALRRLDSNGDGGLSLKEVIPSEEVLRAGLILLTFDVDGDGILSPTEQQSGDLELFQRADVNRDGRVTREELQNELRARKKR